MAKGRGGGYFITLLTTETKKEAPHSVSTDRIQSLPNMERARRGY